MTNAQLLNNIIIFRIRLYRALQLVDNPEENLLYMGTWIVKSKSSFHLDTDSIIYKVQQNDGLSRLMGDYLGQMTNEVPNNWQITKFATVGPKTYAYQMVCHTI